MAATEDIRGQSARPRVRVRERDRRWRPPHCPNPACRWHTATDVTGWRIQRRGHRRNLRNPSSPNQRFVCCTCGRWFCRAAFTVDYWKKVRALLPRVYDALSNGGALRQVGRELDLTGTTILRAQRVLAAQALLRDLLYRRRLRGRLQEPLALDGQRNLVHSVHQMAEINSLYTCESGYTLELDAFGIRQSVGRDPRRLRRRQQSERRWGRPDPKARLKSSHRVLRRLAPLLDPELEHEIRTDEERDYEPPIRELARHRRLRHVRISAKARRDSGNPLWMANHKHRLQRHSLANLRRETIAQSKLLAGLQDRLLVHRVWLNATKGVSERTAAGRGETPAMRLGLTTRPLRGAELFAERLFPRRCGLPAALLPLYEGRVKGWPNEKPARRVPKYAC